MTTRCKPERDIYGFDTSDFFYPWTFACEDVVNVHVTAHRVEVRSPYNEAFIAGAKRLGGAWERDSKQWVFPASLETKVRALCIEVYGEDFDPTNGDPGNDPMPDPTQD